MQRILFGDEMGYGTSWASRPDSTGDCFPNFV
jgi:hypothetical protein